MGVGLAQRTGVKRRGPTGGAAAAWYKRPQEVTRPVPPDRRPPSPFLLLLTTACVTALGVEWLRFQGGWGVAALPAVAGGVWSLWRTARAVRERRRWRLGREAPPMEAGVPTAEDAAEAPHAVRARPATTADHRDTRAPAPAAAPRGRPHAERDREAAASRRGQRAAEDTLAER